MNELGGTTTSLSSVKYTATDEPLGLLVYGAG